MRVTCQERAKGRAQVDSLASPFGSSILRRPRAAAYLLHWLSLGGPWVVGEWEAALVCDPWAHAGHGGTASLAGRG